MVTFLRSEVLINFEDLVAFFQKKVFKIFSRTRRLVPEVVVHLLKSATPDYDGLSRIWKVFAKFLHEILIAFLSRNKSHELHAAVRRRRVEVAHCLKVGPVVHLVQQVVLCLQRVLIALEPCFYLLDVEISAVYQVENVLLEFFFDATVPS